MGLDGDGDKKRDNSGKSIAAVSKREEVATRSKRGRSLSLTRVATRSHLHPKSLSHSKPKRNLRPTTVTYSSPNFHPSYAVTLPEVEVPAAKKKLVVRGLRNFVKTRKRREIADSGAAPLLWRREFISKGKFHPDRYIYDFMEGPSAPPRPVSAMARCKKHGGRCKACGICTCDLCPMCRKCEIDCACPSRGKQQQPSQMDAYNDIFGGEAWRKTCKVITDLTTDDKRNPVGGNRQKYMQTRNAQNCNLYQSQIDVLNPYNIPLTEPEAPPAPQLPPPMMHPYSMYPPPMFPTMMPFMPMPMMMPHPMMSFMPPQCPYPMYDPYCVPPPPYQDPDQNFCP